MKKTIIMSFLWMITVLASGLTFAINDNPLIDIGLVYGQNNVYPVGVSSDSGFLFGYTENDVFMPVMDLTAYKGLVVHKVGYYSNLSNLSTDVTLPAYIAGNIKGAHTIIIGDAYGDYNTALAVMNQYKEMYDKVYLRYEEGWTIGYDTFITEGQAIEAVNTLSLQITDQVLSVKKQKPQMVIIYGDKKPLVAYDTGVDSFALKADVYEYNNNRYRNSLVIKRLPASDFSIINRLTMNEYLYGVLPKEMSGDWPIEALKAQAIAARNFALVNSNKHQEYGFDLCTTTDCQVYGGYGVEKANSNLAVDLTTGEYLLYQGDLVSCYYHSNSGGKTEDISNIWSGDLPYIKGVDDPYSLGQPNANWELTLSASQIETALSNAGFSIGKYVSTDILSFSDNGRVTKMIVHGTSGDATLLKEKARSVFGYTTLKSMYFSFGESQAAPVAMMSASGLSQSSLEGTSILSATGLSVSTDETYWFDGKTLMLPQRASVQTTSSGGALVLYGHGYGHGLGMSQWGAKAMAEAGFDYKSILTHYYYGTSVVKGYSK